ncbi:MAG: hypothetical protein PUC06_00795 [Oscillospiraceae bacterium]|nr:hypothetical protein [Oscillospiraceae bacterium]
MTPLELAKCLTNIDSRLIEQAEKTPRKKPRRMRPLRMALIAAALAVLLLTAVLAANEEFREWAMEFGRQIIGLEQQEEVSSSMETEPQKLSGWRLDGTQLEFNFLSYGNLFPVEDGYMTLTDQGPQPVEVTHVDTTLNIYGQWELELDYAVIDGELALYNLHTPNDDWTALAAPVAGSTDTVLLTIQRLYENPSAWHYPVLYNLITGELSDPLADTELFSHGSVDTIEFSESLKQFIVHIYSETQHDDRYFLGSMEDGTLRSIKTMAGTQGTQQGCFWVDGNHLCIGELVEEGNQQFSVLLRLVDTDTGAVVSAISEEPDSIYTGNIDQQRYADCISGEYRFRDLLTGEVWGGLPSEASPQGETWIQYKFEQERYDLLFTDKEIFLVDREQRRYLNLSEVLDGLPKQVQQIQIFGAGSLTVGGEDEEPFTMYYRIDRLTGWQPLTRIE